MFWQSEFRSETTRPIKGHLLPELDGERPDGGLHVGGEVFRRDDPSLDPQEAGSEPELPTGLTFLSKVG